jgi:hypothetical protein
VSRGAIWFELPQVVATGNGAGPTSGYIDVAVRADAGDLPKLVSAFNVDFFTTSASLQLGAPQAPPNPLIAGTPLNFSPNGQHVRAALDLAIGGNSLADGMGLVRVPFEVPAGVTGVFPLAFGPANQLADPNAFAIGLQTTDTGSITVSQAIPGDYDGNGSVGAEDYMVWRSNVGRSGPLAADGNGDHMVDAADYVVWRKNLGSGGTSQPGQSAGLIFDDIPEPATLVLLFAAAPLVLARRGDPPRVNPRSLYRGYRSPAAL